MVFIEYNNNQICLKSTVNIVKNAMYYIPKQVQILQKNSIKAIKVR